tara:strand:- start:629 stop:802 length:174 start_codon:yes stop_codon:yes gene_type:complete
MSGETKVKIIKKDSNWSMVAILFKENKDKIFVYSDTWARIEHHFPKDTHYYKKLEEQ